MSFALSPRRAIVALAAAAASVATVASLGGTASAGSECPKGTLCVYQDNDFGGQLVKIKPDGISNKLAEQMNNEASSVFNNRNRRSYLYDRKDGNGDKVCVSPKTSFPILGGDPDFNDVASSSRNTDNDADCPPLR